MEEKIIKGLLEKDEEILALFVAQYGKIIYASIKNILCYPNERGFVEECFDDVILLVWKNIDLYTGKGKFKSWLTSIARFKALDYKKKYKKLQLNDEIEEDTLIQSSKIEENLIKTEEDKILNNLVSKLNETDQIIIRLKYFKDYSIEEISKAINFSPAFIYNRISRAKKKLQILGAEVNYYD